MGPRAEDLTGQRFGRLVAERLFTRQPRPKWRLRCDCGGVAIAASNDLKRGAVTSCGCVARARAAERATTHGRSATSEWDIWNGMLRRCTVKSHPSYPRYGGRGITVCARWQQAFENFYADMGPRPSARHSLDRIDNDGPYSPQNCRWATPTEQTRNRRTTVRLSYQGLTLTVPEWAARTGLPYRVILDRVQRQGWSAERALRTPVGPSHR